METLVSNVKQKPEFPHCCGQEYQFHFYGPYSLRTYFTQLVNEGNAKTHHHIIYLICTVHDGCISKCVTKFIQIDQYELPITNGIFTKYEIEIIYQPSQFSSIYGGGKSPIDK